MRCRTGQGRDEGDKTRTRTNSRQAQVSEAKNSRIGGHPGRSFISLLSCVRLKMETANEGFKIPSLIPQDLLLIQDIIGTITPTQTTPPVDTDDSVDSSGESVDSADEVEANLISVGVKSERSVSCHPKFSFI